MQKRFGICSQATTLRGHVKWLFQMWNSPCMCTLQTTFQPLFPCDAMPIVSIPSRSTFTCDTTHRHVIWYIYTYVYIYIYIYIYIYVYTYWYTYTHIHTYVYIYLWSLSLIYTPPKNEEIILSPEHWHTTPFQNLNQNQNNKQATKPGNDDYQWYNILLHLQ